MSETIVPAFVEIANGEPGVLYAIVPSFGGAYAAGNDGSIWSCVKRGGSGRHLGTTWRRLKGCEMKTSGYICVTIIHANGKYKPTAAHQLVAEAWHGPRPDNCPATRHLNGNKLDNRPDNLAWGTDQENMLDRDRHGDPTYRGDGHPQAVLTSEIVMSLRSSVAGGSTVKEAANEHGVDLESAYSAVSGRTWSHLPGAIPRFKQTKDEDREMMRELQNAGMDTWQIMERTGLSYHRVYNATRRKGRAIPAAQSVQEPPKPKHQQSLFG